MLDITSLLFWVFVVLCSRAGEKTYLTPMTGEIWTSTFCANIHINLTVGRYVGTRYANERSAAIKERIMNLILLKQSEIQTTSTSSSSGDGGDDSTKVETSLFVNLPSKDERAKHITNHLHKKSGETVSIGIIDHQKGKAIVHHYHHNNSNSGDNSMDGGGGGSGIRLEIQSETLVTPSATPEITLVLAVPFPMRIKALWPVIASFTSVTRVVIIKGE